ETPKKKPRSGHAVFESGRQESSRLFLGSLLVEELFVLGRALERRRRGLLFDRRRYCVEVAGANLALVLYGSEALFRRGELGFLQFDERGHLLARVTVGKVEHRVVQ